MEDRHSVSEPRPVDGGDGKPSWEVDILRDDTLVVDTFSLSNDNLPPRTNKKGKVVWRLPDKADKLPSFGTDDRRRILNLFKDRKKKRKQKKKRNPSPSNDGSPAGSGNCERRDSTDKSPGEKQSRGSSTEARSNERKANNGSGSKTKSKGKENGKAPDNLSKERDASDVVAENGKGRRKKREHLQPKGRKANEASSNGPLHSPASPPSVPPTPPPGLGSTPTHALREATSCTMMQAAQLHQQEPNTPDPSRMRISDPQQQPPKELAQGTQVPTSQPPSIESLPTDALFITVPRNERPASLPGQPESSLAVPAARHFISAYYSHFDGTGNICDLIRYYTTKAQKSVSIGGAHSVVTGRRDIAAQIMSLAGAAFVVRGVVAQDTADGKGVHILVTGTARTGLNGSAGGVVASFAHSVSLVPIDRGQPTDGSCPGLLAASEVGFPFQIHNDLLALISGDAGPVAPVPIPQQVPLQQQPPPPPGLF